jgi:regulator of sigma E protease
MSILKFIVILLEVVVLFNLLIFVHEVGHFLAARWRGLKIDRLAIWFGKPIWKKKVNGIEYALGFIPAGGYVALPQMATMEAIEGKSENSGQPLPPISPLDKIIVAFAGPLFSFLLALAFGVVVWIVGRPMPQNGGNSTLVGWVDPSGPAGKGGLLPGDRILEIDHQPVTQFAAPSQQSVMWRVITSQGTNIDITYERGGETHVVQVTPFKRATRWYERRALRQILVDPAEKAIVDSVATNSPASAVGLESGDEIVAVNGQKIYSPMALVLEEDLMTNGPINPVKVKVRRGASEFEQVLLAKKPLKPANSGPSFGIIWQANTNVVLAHPGPFSQVREGVDQILGTIGAVFSPKSDVGVQQLGGVVMIVRLYTNLFQNENGWRQVLWWSVVINVNLALLNLLPFPVLDGGHIVLGLLEVVRRRPFNARVLDYLQTGCAVLLIGFMVFICFYDTTDWVRSARKSREQPVVFAPRN